MVAGENAEGNLKKLLSACRQLDKLRLHPTTVEAGDGQVVKWLAKRRVRGESALVRWAPTGCPFPSRTRRDYRRDGKRLLDAQTSKGAGGMHCVGVERPSCGSGAPASRRSCSQEGGSLPVSPRTTATRRTRGPAKDGCTSRFRWTGWGARQAERSSTGQKNDLWTVCGQDGSERICETLHLSDARGLRRVRSTQRAHKCRAHKVRQQVQQRRRIPVHGV